MGVLPDRIIRCPACGTMLRLPVINESLGMAEAKRWVDGYVQYPLVTEPPVFSICPGCSSPFWIADAAVAGTFSFTATEGCDPGWEKLPYVPDPSYMSILKALPGGAAARLPIGHEIYLRLLGMQKFNHGRRVHVHYARACRGTRFPSGSRPIRGSSRRLGKPEQPRHASLRGQGNRIRGFPRIFPPHVRRGMP